MAGEALTGTQPVAGWLLEPCDPNAHAWCADCRFLAEGEWAHKAAWHHSLAHMTDPKIHVVHLWTPDENEPVLNAEDAAAVDVRDLIDANNAGLLEQLEPKPEEAAR